MEGRDWRSQLEILTDAQGEYKLLAWAGVARMSGKLRIVVPGSSRLLCCRGNLPGAGTRQQARGMTVVRFNLLENACLDEVWSG
jgi:hypothetical protein